MQTHLQTGPRPEAMADVPGACEISLTRAVVRYRDAQEIGRSWPGAQDIGLALVLEGGFASAAETVDLGSGALKQLDLGTELAVIDWVYQPTLHHVSELLRLRAAGAGGGELRTYGFDLALRILGRVGWTPLTRPVLMRIGFRDVCWDLDLHEQTSVRVVVGEGRVVRAHVDCDASTLFLRTSSGRRDPALEETLAQAFSGQEIRRTLPSGGGPLTYLVRFPLPASLRELRSMLHGVRSGLGHLFARFELERYRSVETQLATFGARDTLARIHLREEPVRSVPMGERSAGPVVH